MVLKNLFNYNLERVTSEDVIHDRYVIEASTKTKKSFYITNHTGYYPNFGCKCHKIVEDEDMFKSSNIDHSVIDINFNKLLLYVMDYDGQDYTIRDSDLSEIIHHTDKIFYLTLNYDREILKIAKSNGDILFDKILDHFKGIIR